MKFNEPVASKRISIATARRWKWLGRGAQVVFNHADGTRRGRTLRLAYCLGYPDFYRAMNTRAGNDVPTDLNARFYIRVNGTVYEVIA